MQDVTFIGSSIVTVGVRHVRVWRFDAKVASSPSKPRRRMSITEPITPTSTAIKTLVGRNCLLGALLEAKSFICVIPVSSSKALTCTDRYAISPPD